MSFWSRIGRREEGRPSRAGAPSVFPGAPIMSLTEEHYYLVAVLEPVFQIAIMQHLEWYGGSNRHWWIPYIPRELPIGDARVVPLIDLGKEVAY